MFGSAQKQLMRLSLFKIASEILFNVNKLFFSFNSLKSQDDQGLLKDFGLFPLKIVHCIWTD